MKPRVLLAASLGLTCLSACATFQAYEGAKLPAGQVAIVSGNSKLRTVMPVAVVIRSVDGRPVDLRYSAVALDSGRHELVVDCQVGGAEASISRHVLNVEVSGGERYQLRPDMNPGNRSCKNVALEPT